MKPSTCTPRSLRTQRTRRHEVRRRVAASSFHLWQGGPVKRLHLYNVPVFQQHVRVAFQRREVTYAVVNRHTGGESDAWGRREANEAAESETLSITQENLKNKKPLPFFMSFSLLKILPVSAAMNSSPFWQRLSTETPAAAASATFFKASEGQHRNQQGDEL